MTLEEYFRDCIARNVIDHSIRASEYSEGTRRETQLRCYIHPSGKNGHTLDFIVEGNTLTPVKNGMEVCEHKCEHHEPYKGRDSDCG